MSNDDYTPRRVRRAAERPIRQHRPQRGDHDSSGSAGASGRRYTPWEETSEEHYYADDQPWGETPASRGRPGRHASPAAADTSRPRPESAAGPGRSSRAAGVGAPSGAAGAGASSWPEDDRVTSRRAAESEQQRPPRRRLSRTAGVGAAGAGAAGATGAAGVADAAGYQQYQQHERFEGSGGYPDRGEYAVDDTEQDYAAAAAGEDVEAPDDDNGEERGSGVPYRFLAMVLVAIALVCLVAGLWMLVSPDDDGSSTTDTSGGAGGMSTSAPAEAQPNQEGAPSARPTIPGSESTAPAPKPDSQQGAAPNGDAPAAGVDRGAVAVAVYNNSQVANRAAQERDRLAGAGWNVTTVGNCEESSCGKLQQTTVFYTAGNEVAAQEIARESNIEARPIEESGLQLPASEARVIVVLAGNA